MASPRRTELENKLPPAPQTMLQHVWAKCAEAGIPTNKEDFVFMQRAVVDYLVNTGEGKKVMLKVLNSSVATDAYTKQFYQAGHVGDEEYQLDYRALVEYRGWIYKGKAVPHEAIAVWDKPDMEACEMCGGLFPKTHCLVTVKTYSGGKEHLENMCNKCRLRVEDTKIRDTASNKTCEGCKITACQHYPGKLRQIMGEPAQVKQIEHKQTPIQRYSAI